MRIESAEFVKSATDIKSFIKDGKPQICVVGRSNVGKSSFINMMTGQNICRVSATPGRTRAVNYIKINDGQFYFTDLPGYGYQSGSKAEANRWRALLESYFENADDIRHVFLLLDIRHDPTEKDKIMLNYLYHYNLPFSVLASKADKLSRAAQSRAINSLSAQTGLGKDNIIPISSFTGFNKDKVLSRIGQVLAL